MDISRVCEACGESTVRTICNECRELYCKNCSDYHLRFKATRNHHLIDLHPKYGDQSQKTTESADEAELSSDFVEQLTVTENTVLYRAQVAVDREVQTEVGAERGAVTKGNEIKGTTKGSSSTQGETGSLGYSTAKKDETTSSHRLAKDSEIKQFSIKRPDDKENAQVQGIFALSKKIIVADSHNKKLKLFDQKGEYLSSVDSFHCVWGITAVAGNRFATCGLDTVVRLWTVRGKAIVVEDISYDIEHESHGIHYNGTYYCVMHRWNNAITVLDTQGRQVRKIVRREAFGKEIQFGLDIHMDKTTNNIYVSCLGSNKGVFCLSVHDEALWFTPLDGAPGGIIEIDGVLCVSDCAAGNGLQMVSKTGEYKRKLLDKDVLNKRKPEYVCFDANDGKLYFNLDSSNAVCFISV